MQRILSISTSVCLLLCCAFVAAQDNPFMPMAGKRYADYSREVYEQHWKCQLMDSMEVRKVIGQMEEVAQTTGSTEWRLQAEYFELSLLDSYKPFGQLTSNEQRIDCRTDLLRRTQKARIPHLEMKVRNNLIMCYCLWEDVKNYELALELCETQNRQLQAFSQDDLPEISRYYLQIADLHAYFKDYAKALPYYEKIAGYPEIMSNQWYKQGALNGMGLYYRYSLNDLDRSDSCFHAILQIKHLSAFDAAKREVWEGIAEGNIGRNRVLRKAYDTAIPLLESSMDKMVRYNDFAFSVIPAVFLAMIYIEKGKYAEARHYLDTASLYNAVDNRDGNLPLIYEAKSKYYAATGDSRLCIAYMDSLSAENNKLGERFNALQMMRVEQRKHLSEQAWQHCSSSVYA